MTGSVAIDIVISLVFVYLIYSLLATIVQEIVASNIMRLRSKVLEEAIRRMLDDNTNKHGHANLLSNKFFDMPLIKYLGQTNKKKPAYLASRNFSKTLIDILVGPDTKPGDDFRIKIDHSLNNGIGVMDNNVITQGDTIDFIKSLWADAQGDVDRFRIALERWFDDGMDRATGWYKRRIQKILFFIGLAIAVIFNVDTIDIVHKFSNNPKLTAQVVQQADNFIKAHPNLDKELQQQKESIDKNLSPADSAKEAKAAEELYKRLKAQQDSLLAQADTLLKKDIANLNGVLGTGIQSYEFRGSGPLEIVGYFLLSVIGWIITALALSLGAPFWFDLLNKLMKLRASVPIAADDKAKASTSGGQSSTITIKG